MNAKSLITVGSAMVALTLSSVIWAQSRSGPDEATLTLGKQLFMAGAAPACHTLKDAGSEGAVGPVLDELKPGAAQIEKAVREGLGVMPAYKATLDEVQIKALAAYVSHAAGKP